MHTVPPTTIIDLDPQTERHISNYFSTEQLPTKESLLREIRTTCESASDTVLIAISQRVHVRYYQSDPHQTLGSGLVPTIEKVLVTAMQNRLKNTRESERLHRKMAFCQYLVNKLPLL